MSHAGREPALRPPADGVLDDWLAYLETLNPRTIELGLERAAAVRRGMGLDPAFIIVTVGGTNGKGSTCAMLEAILLRAGVRVGCYTSPHLLRYNERVRLDGVAVPDARIACSLARVEAARGATPLTYFEFGTLAAVDLFAEAGVEVAILEVGLGGRLDAVNVFDPDVAVVTCVALDHMDWLGDNREAIGREKAGIFRAGRPAVCADPEPPASIAAHAAAVGARLLQIGRDFGYAGDRQQWSYRGPAGRRSGLPHPGLRGDYQLRNAAACLTVLDLLRDRLPVSMGEVRAGLLEVELPGRFQVLPGQPVVILDVAHNPQAAQALAGNLAGMGLFRRTVAVFGMLSDKDIRGVVRAVKPCIDEWHVAALPPPRGTPANALADALRAEEVAAPVQEHANPADAFERAWDAASRNDRIVVFGSFYTVADVLRKRGMPSSEAAR